MIFPLLMQDMTEENTPEEPSEPRLLFFSSAKDHTRQLSSVLKVCSHITSISVQLSPLSYCIVDPFLSSNARAEIMACIINNMKCV